MPLFIEKSAKLLRWIFTGVYKYLSKNIFILMVFCKKRLYCVWVVLFYFPKLFPWLEKPPDHKLLSDKWILGKSWKLILIVYQIGYEQHPLLSSNHPSRFRLYSYQIIIRFRNVDRPKWIRSQKGPYCGKSFWKSFIEWWKCVDSS